MARYVSFAILLVVIVFMGIIFFRVMSGFLIPLFLAALFVVIFSPVNDWFIGRYREIKALQPKRRAEQLAALTTTGLVSLVILVPILIMLLLAVNEARWMVTSTSTTEVMEKVKEVRTSLNLDVPAVDVIHDIEEQFQTMRKTVNPEQIKNHRQLLFEIKDETRTLSQVYKLTPPTDEEIRSRLEPPAPPETNEDSENLTAEDETRWKPLTPFGAFYTQLSRVTQLAQQFEPDSDSAPQQFHEYQLELIDLEIAFHRLKNDELLGTNAWLKELANPTEQQMLDWGDASIQFASDQLLKFGTASTSFLVSLIIGILVMLFALYFFLLDGHSMIESLKGLSPMDDDHEQELIKEFSKISRAVVLATLLSAVAQGALAGVAYYFVGLQSIFLLTMLTTGLAMVPFMGAATVWVPSCFYLYFVEGSLGGAIGLGIFGALVISMADNFIKPAVLHGQSNLHPLLALLSIVGGVSALGPIGILIGPMIVAFLQTLLEIFQREIRTIDMEGVAENLLPAQTAQSGSGSRAEPDSDQPTSMAEEESE